MYRTMKIGNKKHAFFLLVAVLLGLAIQSCSRMAIGLAYNSTFSPKNDVNSDFELQLSSQSHGNHLGLQFSFAMVTVDREKTYFGAGVAPIFNFFPTTRLQPFVGCNINVYAIEKDKPVGIKSKEDELAPFLIKPHVGARFYFTDNMAITGNVGYSATSFFGSGLGFSIGLSYSFKVK